MDFSNVIQNLPHLHPRTLHAPPTQTCSRLYDHGDWKPTVTLIRPPLPQRHSTNCVRRPKGTKSRPFRASTSVQSCCVLHERERGEGERERERERKRDAIIQYLKNLPILYHWNDRTIYISIWSMVAFPPTPKALVLYVYIIQWFVWASSTVPSRCYIPYRYEKKKHWDQCRVDLLLCKIRLT